MNVNPKSERDRNIDEGYIDLPNAKGADVRGTQVCQRVSILTF